MSFIIGLIVGGNIGFFIACLCSISARAERNSK